MIVSKCRYSQSHKLLIPKNSPRCYMVQGWTVRCSPHPTGEVSKGGRHLLLHPKMSLQLGGRIITLWFTLVLSKFSHCGHYSLVLLHFYTVTRTRADSEWRLCENTYFPENSFKQEHYSGL